MKTFVRFLFYILVCSFFAFGCKSPNNAISASSFKGEFFSLEGKVLGTFDLEVAETEQKRAFGLMFRNDLKPDQGMIFIFPDDDVRTFWMKNTPLSLDMIFLDSQLNVVSIYRDAVPYTTDPRDSNGKAARYVVEVLAGTAKRLDIQIGAKLRIYGSLPLPS